MPDDSVETPSLSGPSIGWTPLCRLAFRFGLIYLVLDTFVPRAVWVRVVVPFGASIGVRVDIYSPASGDTTFDYVRLLLLIGLVCIGTGVWSAIERRKTPSPWLAEWGLVLLRYRLAFALAGYGWIKVWGRQFGDHGLAKMMLPFGDGSPMGLAWRFMGHSVVYQGFAGGLELLAAMLLLGRRTTTLGAALACVVMANVVLMNFCFDIPVKLFSCELLTFSLILVALDARRVLDVFVFQRATRAHEFPPHFDDQRIELGRKILKGVLVVGYLAGPVFGLIINWGRAGSTAAHAQLRGIYEVEFLAVDGKPRPGSIDDHSRPRYVIFDRPSWFTIAEMDHRQHRYALDLDLVGDEGTMEVTPFLTIEETVERRALPENDRPEVVTHTWAVRRLDPDHYELEGVLDGHQLEMHLQRRQHEFSLTSRGFHWVNELPYNE